MSRYKNQTGSIHLIITIILMLALLGALGFVVWENINKTSSKQTINSTSNGNQTNGETRETSLPFNRTEVIDFVNEFYNKYYNFEKVIFTEGVNDSTAKNSSSQELSLIEEYSTSNFINKYNDYRNSTVGITDPVLHVQNMPDVAPRAANYEIVDGKAAEVIIEVVISGDSYLVAKVVVIKDNGSLKIDSISQY